MRYTVHTHGYSGYGGGCRCAVCRQAKADYMSDRRAAAFLEPGQPVPGITHGRFGYEERGCRCDACVEARRKHWRQDSNSRRPKSLAVAA